MRAAVLAALLVAGLAAPATTGDAQRRAVVARDWSRTVVATPEGGFRMGNPAARVRIVEFVSLACPHCAEFARDGAPSLIRNYVKTGRVSFEYRNLVINAPDVAAAMLARCAGPAGYFRIADRFLASQAEWQGRISALSAPQRDQLRALPPLARIGRLAELSGLTAIAAQNGLPAARARACLADQAAFDRIGQISEAGAALGVQGTPSFLVNGRLVDAHDWSSLEPLIRGAGG